MNTDQGRAMKTASGGLMLAMAFAVSGGVAQVPVNVEMPVRVAVAGVPEPGAPQVKDGLFEGTEKFAAGAKDVTEVNMDKNMLGMMGGKGAQTEVARKMDFVVVRTYTYEKAGMYRDEDVEVYRKRLQDGNWSCMVHTRDKNGSTDICMRAGADNETHEMVVLTAEPKELTFVHLKGRMPFADLGKMAPAPPTPPLQPRKP